MSQNCTLLMLVLRGVVVVVVRIRARKRNKTLVLFLISFSVAGMISAIIVSEENKFASLMGIFHFF
jgi:hypothetical protein